MSETLRRISTPPAAGTFNPYTAGMTGAFPSFFAYEQAPAVNIDPERNIDESLSAGEAPYTGGLTGLQPALPRSPLLEGDSGGLSSDSVVSPNQSLGGIMGALGNAAVATGPLGMFTGPLSLAISDYRGRDPAVTLSTALADLFGRNPAPEEITPAYYSEEASAAAANAAQAAAEAAAMAQGTQSPTYGTGSYGYGTPSTGGSGNFGAAAEAGRGGAIGPPGQYNDQPNYGQPPGLDTDSGPSSGPGPGPGESVGSPSDYGGDPSDSMKAGGLVGKNQFKEGGLVPLAGGGKIAVGPGGGLDDLIPTSINGRRAAALSDGEFVIPADVVSMMGDGSTNAGSRRLYDLVRQVRDTKTGTTRQASPLPVGEILKRSLSR